MTCHKSNHRGWQKVNKEKFSIFNFICFNLNFLKLGISANANSPGVSGAPKVSPLAQINNGNASPAIHSPQPMSAGMTAPPPPPPPPMGQMAMGMPFQVLPPPPPPPMQQQQQKLSPPQSNGNARKSPQSFEPPPMGYRPEIKIPENPMATLRKVARPQQRDDYWVQEFMQEKARDSLPEDTIRQQIASSPIIQQQQQQRQEYVPMPPSPKPATPVSVPSTPQYMQMKSPSPERQEINIPIRNIKLDEIRSASPQQQRVQSPPVAPSSPVTVNKNIVIEPMQQPRSPQQQQQQHHVNFQPNQPQGGRIILSTMPNRPQQTQNVS